MQNLKNIRQLYQAGQNIIETLTRDGLDKKSAIEISYDLQAGSYRDFNRLHADYVTAYSADIAAAIAALPDVGQIMEAGCGEATTLIPVLQQLGRPVDAMGFDLAWSRIRHGYAYAAECQVQAPFLFTADLFDIPLADGSIDLVYTYHSIEPNGGKEAEAMQELYRVCRRYLLLIEPSYELASAEGRARMERLGYVRDLPGVARQLGYKVVANHAARHFDNPLNPTQYLLIEKPAMAAATPKQLRCPITGEAIHLVNGHYASEQGPYIYPVIDGVPCLARKNAIVATQFAAFSAPASGQGR